MNVFNVNDLLVCLNESTIKDKVFVSISVDAGFSSNRLSVGEKEVIIGSAAVKVFFNYIKSQVQSKYDFQINCDVTTNTSTIFWETDSSKYKEEIQNVIDEILTSDIDVNKLMTEKEMTITRFKENYKHLEFRGRMKMLEFTDANKNFNFKEFSNDLLEVDEEKVRLMRETLCFPNSMFLFVHGDGGREVLEQLTIPTHENKDIGKLFEQVQWAFQQDVVLKKASKGNYQMGSIKFERSPTETDLTAEHAVLSMIGEILFEGSHEVNVDPMDVSLNYFKSPIKEYKHDVYSCITEETVEKAKVKINKKLQHLIVNNQKEFVLMAGTFYMNKVDIFEWMQLITTLEHHQILSFLKERDYKVREGYLNYYKEENRYVV
ncbi:hypothetical protein BTS2_1991 [Bacillus sp. TS-2]|nr:hypothetical protein BTS2_1991 [Bacillus sp. TS-2]